MTASTRDQVKGKLDHVKGKLKQLAGIVAGRPRLEAEGKGNQLTGAARKKLGQVEKVAGK